MTSTKWKGLNGAITAEAAEAEPERERLFSRPAPRPSPETLRMLAQAKRRQEVH